MYDTLCQFDVILATLVLGTICSQGEVNTEAFVHVMVKSKQKQVLTSY